MNEKEKERNVCEKIENRFRARNLLPNQVVQIVERKDEGLFVFYTKLRGAIILERVLNKGFSFPDWEKQGTLTLVYFSTFLERISSLETKEE